MRYVKRAVLVCGTAALLCWLFSVAAYATGSGDVAGAVESTWAALETYATVDGTSRDITLHDSAAYAAAALLVG